jgi:hypothetical protein
MYLRNERVESQGLVDRYKWVQDWQVSYCTMSLKYAYSVVHSGHRELNHLRSFEPNPICPEVSSLMPTFTAQIQLKEAYS